MSATAAAAATTAAAFCTFSQDKIFLLYVKIKSKYQKTKITTKTVTATMLSSERKKNTNLFFFYIAVTKSTNKRLFAINLHLTYVTSYWAWMLKANETERKDKLLLLLFYLCMRIMSSANNFSWYNTIYREEDHVRFLLKNALRFICTICNENFRFNWNSLNFMHTTKMHSK